MTFDVRKLIAVLAAGLLAAGTSACGGGDSGDSGGSGGSTATSTGTPSGGGNLDGKAMFAGTCGGCHTLKAAGTTGSVGPNLDDLKPDKATVLDAIKSGPGVMPENLYTGAEAEAVAEFVSANAGK